MAKRNRHVASLFEAIRMVARPLPQSRGRELEGIDRGEIGDSEAGNEDDPARF